jgi:hypothetical protein
LSNESPAEQLLIELIEGNIAENNLRAQLGAGSVSKNSYIDLTGEATLPRSRKCE